MATFEVGQRVPLGNGQFGEIIAVSEATAQQRVNRDRILARSGDDPRERRGNLPREFMAIRLPDGTTSGITVKDNGGLIFQRGQSTTGTGPISGGPSLSQLGSLIGSNLSATRGQNVNMSPEQRRALTFNQLRQGRRAAADVISDATGTPLTNQATGGQERGNMALPNLTGNARTDVQILTRAFLNDDISEAQFRRSLEAIGFPESAIQARLNALPRNTQGQQQLINTLTTQIGDTDTFRAATAPAPAGTGTNVGSFTGTGETEAGTGFRGPDITPDDFADTTGFGDLFELTPNEQISQLINERFGSVPLGPSIRRAIGRRTSGLESLFDLMGAVDPSNLQRTFGSFARQQFNQPTTGAQFRRMLSQAASGDVDSSLVNEIGIAPNASTRTGFFRPTTNLVQEVAGRSVSPFFRDAVRRRAARRANEILLNEDTDILTAQDFLRELQGAGIF